MQILLLLVLYFTNEVKCEEKPIKSKNLLPYFRRQVEEISGDEPEQQNITDDPHTDLVSILIKNVKEIYNELDEADNEVPSTIKDAESTVNATSSSSTISDEVILIQTKSSDLVNDTSIVTVENSIDIDSIPIEIKTLFDDTPNTTIISTETDSGTIEMTTEEEQLTSYKNITLISISDDELVIMDRSTKAYNALINKNEELRNLSKKMLFETDRMEQDPKPEVTIANASMFNIGFNENSRSCIKCNNVETENCNSPKNRLIPSVVCKNDDDLCYSMHTPFGVIDRGCFNINNNLTIYVCSCNLCNYITISEMPYIFAKKQDWIDNVIEISRTKNFRHSVLKEMSCLKCEVNSSATNVDELYVSNCLAGNIGALPTEFCDYNEVCAVKAIRKQGYIWRGCIKFPSLNYWWSLCDSDLCNYDPVVSIYETE